MSALPSNTPEDPEIGTTHSTGSKIIRVDFGGGGPPSQPPTKPPKEKFVPSREDYISAGIIMTVIFGPIALIIFLAFPIPAMIMGGAMIYTAIRDLLRKRKARKEQAQGE